ncbi:hypothetical protein [Ammoniphilus resinae]|uniref:Nucleotidase n=1 Tax=Ammoniphilus resinae TaxID=861532 RepID=A0ABS4GXK7_9BACL|nr:hypothetical protein [Ammoniphilus resinae]MBP1934600.1 putative HAD superfamily protein [Ammoniphilus resinae]
MNKINIGIDIDGTLTEYHSFLPYLNNLLGTKVTPEQLTQYDLHEIFGMDYEDFVAVFDEHSVPIYKTSIPRVCAKEHLQWFDRQFNIVYITARYKDYMELTKDWLTTNGFPKRQLVCTGSHDKLQALQEYQVGLMVEDRLENALEIWDKLQVPVYLLDTPYNQAKLPEGIVRVQDWHDIRKQIHHHFKIKER